MVFQWSLSDSKSIQVSRTFLGIQTDRNNRWSRFPLISYSSRFYPQMFGYRFKRINYIKIKSGVHDITLAMSSKRVPIKSLCYLNIWLNNRTYENTWLELIENHCAEILLDLDFQKQLSLFFYNGPELRVNEVRTEVYSVTASNLLVPRLFESLKFHVQLIVTKVRT